MDSKTLIKLLPFIGIALGLLIGEQTRTGFVMSEVSWADLVDGLFNRSLADQRLAKQQLMHLGTYALVGGVLGFVVSLVLQNQNSKEDQ